MTYPGRRWSIASVTSAGPTAPYWLKIVRTGGTIYARGLRNAVGLAWQPSTRRLWAVDNGRDLLGAFRGLAPGRASIHIQRWTLRRIGVTVGAIVSGVIAVSLLWGSLTGAGLG